MHAPRFADMPAAFSPLLEQPAVPLALRELKRSPPPGVTFEARQRHDAKGLFALFSDPIVRDGILTRDSFRTSRDLQTWLSRITASNRFEIVAKADGALIGFAGLYPQADHMRHVGSIMLGVAPEAQGRGVGAFLLQLLVWTAWFVEGLSKVQLTVFSDNFRAVRLYEAAGFRVEGTLRHFTRHGERNRDAHLMALFLE